MDYNGKGRGTMNEKRTAFAQRIEQNSKNYSPKDLFDLGTEIGRAHV